MANFKVGDMWSVWDIADRFVVVLSSQLEKGKAIMAGGMAKVMCEHYSAMELDTAIGAYIAETCGANGVFGARTVSKFGLFQERREHAGGMDLGCVSAAARMLEEQAKEHPERQFHVEQPGQGEPYWMIKDILERMPDNVTFWSKP